MKNHLNGGLRGAEENKRVFSFFFPAWRAHYYSSSPLYVAHLPSSELFNFFTLCLTSRRVHTVRVTNSFFFFLCFSTASVLSLVPSIPSSPPLYHSIPPFLSPPLSKPVSSLLATYISHPTTKELLCASCSTPALNHSFSLKKKGKKTEAPKEVTAQV